MHFFEIVVHIKIKTALNIATPVVYTVETGVLQNLNFVRMTWDDPNPPRLQPWSFKLSSS